MSRFFLTYLHPLDFNHTHPKITNSLKGATFSKPPLQGDRVTLTDYPCIFGYQDIRISEKNIRHVRNITSETLNLSVMNWVVKRLNPHQSSSHPTIGMFECIQWPTKSPIFPPSFVKAKRNKSELQRQPGIDQFSFHPIKRWKILRNTFQRWYLPHFFVMQQLQFNSKHKIRRSNNCPSLFEKFPFVNHLFRIEASKMHVASSCHINVHLYTSWWSYGQFSISNHSSSINAQLTIILVLSFT